MKFTKTPLQGAYLIEQQPKVDERGFFARTFCQEEFRQQGLDHFFIQMNTSVSRQKGTLRGMHYQTAPMEEVKLVRCARGKVWDCIVDMRESSPTFLQWYGAPLSEENHTMMYVPKGFAHGFITLEDDSELFYCVTTRYSAAHERGIRWDDPKIGIQWPLEPKILSEKDRCHAHLSV